MNFVLEEIKMGVRGSAIIVGVMIIFHMNAIILPGSSGRSNVMIRSSQVQEEAFQE
jgi:hypothetical protein